MKIYLDINKRVTGYEKVFYDVKKGIYPDTNLDTGNETKSVLLNKKQDKFIENYLEKGGRITDLIFEEEKFIENKLDRPLFVCGLDLHQTVVVELQDFKPDSDLKRHFNNIQNYTFKELDSIPLDKIKKEYLYYSDKAVLQKEYKGELKRGNEKRYFGLYDKKTLVAFIFLVTLSNMPKISVLYHDEVFDNGGYLILANLIELLKKEGLKYLDLGGLTRDDSGINQFKKKWGKQMLAKNVNLINV